MFYEWNDQDRFRKLKINDSGSEFTNELSNLQSHWDSFSSKPCNYCNKQLPASEYFFKLKGIRGLANKCKECEGYKFCWGKNYKYQLIESGKKYCQSCDTVYTLNELYFNKFKGSKADGYASYCKKCVSGCDFKINRHLNSIVKELKENHKICLECLYELPNTKEYYFGLSKSKDGLEHICKSCQHSKYGIVYIDKVYFSDNGTKCLSYYELLITNWLEQNKINFRKEVFYRDVIEEDNTLRRFDWVITSNSRTYYVEMFGLANFKDYRLNMQNKIAICSKNNLNLISLYPDDLKRPLDEVFSFLYDVRTKVV